MARSDGPFVATDYHISDITTSFAALLRSDESSLQKLQQIVQLGALANLVVTRRCQPTDAFPIYTVSVQVVSAADGVQIEATSYDSHSRSAEDMAASKVLHQILAEFRRGPVHIVQSFTPASALRPPPSSFAHTQARLNLVKLKAFRQIQQRQPDERQDTILISVKTKHYTTAHPATVGEVGLALVKNSEMDQTHALQTFRLIVTDDAFSSHPPSSPSSPSTPQRHHVSMVDMEKRAEPVSDVSLEVKSGELSGQIKSFVVDMVNGGTPVSLVSRDVKRDTDWLAAHGCDGLVEAGVIDLDVAYQAILSVPGSDVTTKQMLEALRVDHEPSISVGVQAGHVLQVLRKLTEIAEVPMVY